MVSVRIFYFHKVGQNHKLQRRRIRCWMAFLWPTSWWTNGGFSFNPFSTGPPRHMDTLTHTYKHTHTHTPTRTHTQYARTHTHAHTRTHTHTYTHGHTPTHSDDSNRLECNALRKNTLTRKLWKQFLIKPGLCRGRVSICSPEVNRETK